MTTEREQKLELDIAALRAELAILMDCINELPDEALDKVPTYKIHKAFLAMSEADKHEHTKTQIDKVMAENDRLREIVTRVRKWAVFTNNSEAIEVLANRFGNPGMAV